MRTSLSEIETIEKFLHAKLPPEEMLLTEARLITDRGFHLNVILQKKVYQLVSFFYREQVKDEVRKYHDEVFSDPARVAFTKKVYQLFK